MEGSKRAAGSSLVSELFGRKDSSAKSSSSPGVFASVFPPAPSVAGKDSSSCPNSSSSRGVSADHGASKGKGSKGRGGLQQNRDKCSGGKMDPCFLSSSVYYGGQDFCSQSTATSNKHYDYKDKQHDSDPIDSRGDWWQGSLYY